MRSRRIAALFVAAGLVMLAASTVATKAARADEEASVGFFEVSADATGIGAAFGNPAAQPYPVAAGLVPNAVAQLMSGPSGRAGASILWPGPLLSSAGSLANVIGTPLPPDVVRNANYPIVAEASAGGGGSDERTLGPMSAKVDATESRATTAITNFSAPGVVTAAHVVTKSRSFLERGRAVSVAESELRGVAIAGILEIARVRTVATGSSDGVAATTSQEVTVAGVTVNGQPATIDRDGIRVGNGQAPTGAAYKQANETLSRFGLRAYVVEPRRQESNGGAGAIDSGSVVVEWNFPGSAQYFTVVLGGSSVRVRATPGAAFEAPVDDFFVPDEPAGVLATPSFSPPAAGGAVAVAPARARGGRVPPARSGGSDPVEAIPIQSGTPIQLASAVSDRAPIGWVLIGILGALLLGAGVHSFRAKGLAVVPASTRCPLERRSP